MGSGLAGAACAHALARRDWNVCIVDSAPPASATSSLPWGLMHPHFATDDNLLARLTRAGSAMTASTLTRVAPEGVHATGVVWRRDGFFQQVSDIEEESRWRSALAAQRAPANHVEWLEQDEACARLGIRPARPGLWWPEGRLISPPRWIAALLDSPGIRFVRGTVDEVVRTEEGWTVRDTCGEVLARAPLLVVAAALDSPRLLRAASLPVQAIPGQVTFISAPPLRSLRAGLGGDGTLLHSPDGRLAVGATYETPLGAPVVGLDERMAARSNLARLERLLAQPVDARIEGRYSGVRCVARDRLPYAGTVADERAAAAAAPLLRGAHFEDLPRHAGLHASFAHGSRGLTFAALAAELIAAQAEGEPLPVERALADAIDPARVLLRRLRRGAVGPPKAETPP